MHDFQSGKEFTQMREQLSQLIEYRFNQMNFELLFIETKRELEKQSLELSHLKHKKEQLKQQAYGNANMTKEFKLKLQRQTDLNSKQHKTILTQNKINSEKSLKVESLLHSVFTLTQEEEIVKTSKYKEEIVLKRTINFLLRENFELKKHVRIKDSYLESAQIEINRLKTKVNRLMLKIEEDNNVNKNHINILGINNIRKKVATPLASQSLNKVISINTNPMKNQNDGMQLLASQGSFAELRVNNHNRRQSILSLRQSTSPKNLQQQPGTHKSNQNSGGSVFDFEILSTSNVFHGPQDKQQEALNNMQGLQHYHDDEPIAARVLSRQIVDVFDIEYRTKMLMDEKEQDLNEELMDGSRQKFIEVTMSSQPLVHKERVDFLAKNYIAFKKLSEKLNSIFKIVLQNLKNTLNELYSHLENNKEIRMSSVDDIVGYVLNNQQDLITADLQKYIQYYQSISKFSTEDKFFDAVKRKSAILLPVKDYDTGMPLGVLEIVNSNSGMFDLDSQYMSYMMADFAGFVINSLNNEIQRRKAEHARTLLNQFAVKIFSQNCLSDLNKVSCDAIKQMLQTDKVKFCFIEESLMEINDYEIIVYNAVIEPNDIDDENYNPLKMEPVFQKFKTKEYFGIMGSVMQSQQPTIIWNPKIDERYNERIDMKTENPMYCFPLLDLNKLTHEKKIVGCVQFENLQLRLLKGTQSLQQQNNPAKTSILIDEHLKVLMKEFSSYIAETLKIIRNQKLLKKFKSFILRAQENEQEHEDDNENTSHLHLLNDPGTGSSKIPNFDVNTELKQYEREELNTIAVLKLGNQGFGDQIKYLQNNRDSHRIILNEKKAGGESNKFSNYGGSQAGNDLQIKSKQAQFNLLKQMTRVNVMKAKQQDKSSLFQRNNRLHHLSPEKQHSFAQEHNPGETQSIVNHQSPDRQLTRTVFNMSRNNNINNKGSVFESESIQDTDDLQSQKTKKLTKLYDFNKEFTGQSNLQIDNN